MWCPSCGRAVPNGSRFCTGCGSSLAAVISQEVSQQRKKNARIVLLLLSFFLFIVFEVRLRSVAALLALIVLVAINVCWDWKTISLKAKAIGLLIAFATVFVAQSLEVEFGARHARLEAERLQQSEIAKKLIEKSRIERANREFTAMSDDQHLAMAKALLHVNAADSDVSLAYRHLDVIGNSKQREAYHLRATYLRDQKKADQVASAHAKEEAKKAAIQRDALEEELRITAAKTMEDKMLDDGMNVDVKAIGPKHTVLHLRYIFVGKVLAHKLSENGEMFESLRKVGFKKLVATDGYEETWTWNI